MRKSLQDISYMVKNIPYPRPLPVELATLHSYVSDSGHCISCIPAVFLPEVTPDNYWTYEVPIPVKYVLKMGWKSVPGTDAISVEMEYDDDLGAIIPDGYDEF